MTSAEMIELALIPVVGVAGWFFSGWLPADISIGVLLLGASVLLLLQGLIRDLWLISRRKQHSLNGTRQHALCMCVESTVGVTGVVAGLVILGSTIDSKLSASPLLISPLAIGILAFDFAVKDLILEFRPFRIRRDKDHLNIVFSWKR
jgi:hypothetical protein